MLYIFNPNEQLIALLKPDFSRSTGPASNPRRAFLSAEFPAEFDREPAEGCPYWGAVHREVLNGESVFQFTVPANQADAAHVTEGNLVAFKDLDAAWQFFEIMRLVDAHGDGLTRTAFCEHVFYELLNDIVTDKRPSSSATAALVSMLEGTRWQVGIVDNLGASGTNAYYENALSAVQKVANAWKGELRWRIIVSNNQITERRVDLLAMRGSDTGKQFAYSKDILSIEREVDTTGIATALYGRGKGVETESGEGYGRRLTFADVVWATPTNPANKPAGQEWIGDPAALAQWGRRGGRHRFDVFIDEDETDPALLLQKTWDELQQRKNPRATYRLDAVSLEQLAGYEHEAVRLGDLTRVIDREFRPELVVSARVIELERHLLAPQNTRVTLGSFTPSITSANIDTKRRVDDLENKPYNTKWLDGKISILQNEIENTVSYVFQTPEDGILIMNAPNFAAATQAMKLGGGIFAIANSKTGDRWNWRTFGTGSGFTADEMNTGVLNASLVKIIGQLIIDGELTLTNEAGTFSVDADGVSITGASSLPGLDAQLSDMQDGIDNAVALDTLYNGIKINTTDGLIVTRSDGKVRVVMNATGGIKIQKYEGSAWVDKLYADTNGYLAVEDLVANRLIMKNGNDVLIDGDTRRIDFSKFQTLLGEVLVGNVPLTELIQSMNTSHLGELNGGVLEIGSVVADKIDVDHLSAISANLGTVIAGALTSQSTIDVTTDATIGRVLLIRDPWNGGIRWNIPGTNIRIYTELSGALILSNPTGPIYANDQRIDQPPIAVFE